MRKGKQNVERLTDNDNRSDQMPDGRDQTLCDQSTTCHLKHKGKAKADPPRGVDGYRPTIKEVALIGKLARDLEAKAPVPSLKMSDDATQVMLNHPSYLVGLGIHTGRKPERANDFSVTVSAPLRMAFKELRRHDPARPAGHEDQ